MVDRVLMLEALLKTFEENRREAQQFQEHWQGKMATPFYQNAANAAAQRWDARITKAINDLNGTSPITIEQLEAH
jgi:hypothetical protein